MRYDVCSLLQSLQHLVHGIRFDGEQKTGHKDRETDGLDGDSLYVSRKGKAIVINERHCIGPEGELYHRQFFIGDESYNGKVYEYGTYH